MAGDDIEEVLEDLLEIDEDEEDEEFVSVCRVYYRWPASTRD